MFVIEYRKKNSDEEWRFHSKYKSSSELDKALVVMNNPSHKLGFEYRAEPYKKVN